MAATHARRCGSVYASLFAGVNKQTATSRPSGRTARVGLRTQEASTQRAAPSVMNCSVHDVRIRAESTWGRPPYASRIKDLPGSGGTAGSHGTRPPDAVARISSTRIDRRYVSALGQTIHLDAPARLC